MKKTLSIILALLIAIISTIPCYAQSENQFNIYAEPINCSKNETIIIPVIIENNNGMMGFKIIFDYDETSLCPLSVQRGEAIQNGLLNDSIGVFENGEFYVVWSNSENMMNNGTLFVLNFKVLDTASANTIINISYSQDDTFDEDWNDVKLNCNNISVNVSDGTVGPNESENESEISDNNCTLIYAEESFADVGDELYVPVRIKNNAGIMGYKLRFEFDENTITPQSVLSAGPNGNIDNNIGMHNDYFNVVWNSTENYYNDGILFYVVFVVLQKIPTEVKITYSADDTFNEDWDEVELSCAPLKINCEYIFPICESTTVNHFEKTISGIHVGDSDISDYIDVIEGYTYSVDMKYERIHTDAKVIVKDINSNTVATYIVVVFGDVNCDGFIDGMDAIIVNCIVNDMLSLDDVGNKIWSAADCNHDKIINNSDATLLEQSGVYNSAVIQFIENN